MEIDFDFELNAEKSDMGVHCLNESWFLFKRDDDDKSSTKQRNTTPACKKDDDISDEFTYTDLNLFGTTPILESFSPLSCILTPTVTNYTITSSTNNDHTIQTSSYNNYQTSTMSCLEIPSYTGGIMSSSSSKSSRKRPLINYSESEHDSAFSSHSPSTASSSSYNQDLDTSIVDTTLSDKSISHSSSTSPPSSIISSTGKKRFQSHSSSSSSSGSSKRQHSNSSPHPTETSARTSGIITSNNPRLNRSERRCEIVKEILPQIENTVQSPCDNLTEPPVEATVCRSRTELIALTGSTPTELLPDAVPTVVDTLLETAGSPTKPTDEPALPDDEVDVKPTIFLTQDTTIDESLTSLIPTPVNLINISVDELSIDKLKLKHPLLFAPHEEDDEPVKKFVKYDPFVTETDMIYDEDNLEPKRKIVKFKYSPFESTDETTSSNLFIMELEETIETQPLPCGVYEIESTKPYYRITPDPGIYETNDDSKKLGVFSPTNFLLDDDGNLNWKLSKIGGFDFDIEQQAPPTPQTPVCMKRIHTDEELTFVNMFSGLYDIETVTPVESVCNSIQIPQLNGIQFRQLVTKPRARSKIGNTITPSLLQDYQMNSTLKNCLNNLNNCNRSRNNRTSSTVRP